MGSCIICGVPVDGGHVCDSHQEDVIFEFRGNHASQLIDNRFYQGPVDGYADFGVFLDLAPGVTGLLHRSELDRRLESLSWEPGDTVCVRVNNVRDNGNIDLGKSIRQTEREFRGKLILDGTEEKLPEELDDETDDETEAVDEPTDEVDDSSAEADDSGAEATEPAANDTDDSGVDADTGAAAESETVAVSHGADTAAETAQSISEEEPATETESASGGAVTVTEREPEATYADAKIESLTDKVDERVRLEGEIVSIRQTGGPTVFELRDETGVVDCAAFVEAGVRAYPEIELGDFVRLDGEIERRRGELQVETDELVALEGDERDAVKGRLADALTDRARPDSLEPIGDHDAVAALEEPLLDVAEAIRRAVLESRPVVDPRG